MPINHEVECFLFDELSEEELAEQIEENIKKPVDPRVQRYQDLDMGKADLTQDEIEKGWHFCIEWDGLLVLPNSPEWMASGDASVCICGRKSKSG